MLRICGITSIGDLRLSGDRAAANQSCHQNRNAKYLFLIYKNF